MRPKVHQVEAFLDLPGDANIYFRTVSKAKRYAAQFPDAEVWRVAGERGAWVSVPAARGHFTTHFLAANRPKTQHLAAKNSE